MSNEPSSSHRSAQASPEFSIVRTHAAGLDIGAEEIWAAIPPDRGKQTVRSFGTFTGDLQELLAWLKENRITSVAMESTGVYWIPVYEVLERGDLEVFLVNAQHVKSVTGRKTDVLDCQWIQKLHACGLLNASFRPSDATVVIRGLFRQRAQLVREAASYVQRMQKALTQMNVQLHHVIADISGTTGLDIIDAILCGERDPMTLAKLRNHRCKKDEATIAKALVGTWRHEHLFALKQALSTWRHLQSQIAEVDAAIAAELATFPDHPDSDLTLALKNKQIDQVLGFDAKTMMYHKTGIDLTAIEGISVTTALTIFSEIGTDLSRFRSSAAFCSWLGLAPNTKVTGGKPISSRTRKNRNRVGGALRMAAFSLQRSKSALGALCRSLVKRLGPGKGIVAMAHRLARYVYAMLTRGAAYVSANLEAVEQRLRQRQLQRLQTLADNLGYNLASREDPLVGI